MNNPSTPAPVDPSAPYVILMTFDNVPMYYTGTVRAGGIREDFTPDLTRAFFYTWESAWRRIHKTPAFAGAVAVEVSTPILF